MKTKQINKKEFKKDFNSNDLTNYELLIKYPFENINELIQFAKENNLVEQKPLTKEEKDNLKLMSKQLNNAQELLQ